MSTEKSEDQWSILESADLQSVHPNGRVWLPKEWQINQEIDTGDSVAVRQRDDGVLEIIPPGSFDIDDF